MGTKTFVRKLLIKAEERLYLIEAKNYGSIYESNAGDQYFWKNVAISMISPDVFQVYCLYLKGGIYVAATDNKNIRQYFKFDLNQKSFTDIACYSDNFALRRSGGNLEVMKYTSLTFKFKAKHAAAYIKKKFTLFYLAQSFEKIKQSNAAIKLNPDSAHNYQQKGFILHEMGRNLEAIECFSKWIKLDPNNGAAYLLKARALHDLGKHIEAIKCYDKIIKFHNEINRSLAFFEKGAALRALGRDLEAIECCDEAAKSDSYDPNPLIEKGDILLYLNRNAEAVECYDLVINTRHDSLKALTRKGHALHELGKYFEAMDCYNNAVETAPNNFILLGYRACLFNDMGKEAEAMQDFNEAYELMGSSKRYDEDLNSFLKGNNSFDGELAQETIGLLKMLSKFQESAIEFKKEMQKLSDDSQSYPEIHKEIAEKERIIKEKHSKLLKRAADSIQNNPIEIIQQIKNEISELQRERSDIAAQLWLLLPKQ